MPQDQRLSARPSPGASRTRSDCPAAIFADLDGTLADSLAIMQLVYRRFLERFGAVPSDTEFATLNGPPLREVAARLKRAHALTPSVEELLSQYHAVLDEAYSKVTAAAGARELLTKAKGNGCVVGVVTSNSASRARSWLAAAGLSQLVDFVVSGDDVAQGKPNPEPYLRATEQARCPANAAIAVEDSAQGAESALAAGLRTYVITSAAATHDWPPRAIPIPSLGHLSELLW